METVGRRGLSKILAPDGAGAYRSGAIGRTRSLLRTDAHAPSVASDETGASVATGAGVEYRRGVCGAAEWRVSNRAGGAVVQLTGDPGQLSAEDVADIEALLARLAARRGLSLVG